MFSDEQYAEVLEGQLKPTTEGRTVAVGRLDDTVEETIRGAVRMVVRARYMIDYADALEDELMGVILTELDAE